MRCEVRIPALAPWGVRAFTLLSDPANGRGRVPRQTGRIVCHSEQAADKMGSPVLWCRVSGKHPRVKVRPPGNRP